MYLFSRDGKLFYAEKKSQIKNIDEIDFIKMIPFVYSYMNPDKLGALVEDIDRNRLTYSERINMNKLVFESIFKKWKDNLEDKYKNVVKDWSNVQSVKHVNNFTRNRYCLRIGNLDFKCGKELYDLCENKMEDKYLNR